MRGTERTQLNYRSNAIAALCLCPMPATRNRFDLSAQQREKIVRLAAEGLSPNALAERFGVTRDAIYKVLAKPDTDDDLTSRGKRPG